jgi:IMP cyclohydrolase
MDLTSALADRPYPGRGLVFGRLTSGEEFIAYFLTGRSEASRARRLEVRDSTDVAVVDTSGGPHDDLRHYLAVAQRGSWLVVGNGDQVGPLAERLAAGTSVLEAGADHTYEPDPPIFTPRIWLARHEQNASPLLGYVRRSERPDGSADRVVCTSDLSAPGAAVLMTTYCGTITDVVTTMCPTSVTVGANSVGEVLTEMWEALDPDLRVAALSLNPGDVAGSLQLRG